MALLHRDVARHHGPGPPATGQPAAGALLAPSLPLSRSAQPRAGRAVEGAPRAEPGRAGAARDSADDQRHLGGAEEYGLAQRRDHTLSHHARACPGHPRCSPHTKSWMAGTSPAMTRMREHASTEMRALRLHID